MRRSYLYVTFILAPMLLYGQRTVEDLLIETTGRDLGKLHRLMTGGSAWNYDRGPGLWKIPYLRNWDGTRAYIKKHGEYIREEDRTPVTFFRDLVDTVQYEGSEGERFYTFGWCSEREMAFCAAARLMGYKAIVVASGNHAYSVVETGDQLYIVDNTLNEFRPIRGESEMPTPSTRLEIWYNRKVKEQYLRLKSISVVDESWRRLTLVNP